MKSTDNWASFVDEGWRRAQAQTGFDREEQCHTVVRARREQPATVGDALAVLVADAEEASTTLLRWIALFMLEEVPSELRSTVLDTLGQRDPPTAALIYGHRSDLTDEEKAILRSLFYPSMPVARAKDIARHG